MIDINVTSGLTVLQRPQVYDVTMQTVETRSKWGKTLLQMLCSDACENQRMVPFSCVGF